MLLFKPRLPEYPSESVSKLPQGLQGFDNKADGRKFQEREGIAIESFPVLGEAAATAEPGNRVFDDPTIRRLELYPIVAD